MGLRMYAADLRAASGSGSALVNLKWFLLNHSLHMVLLVRLGQDCYRVPLVGKVLGFLVEYVVRILFSSDISCRATIGPGFVIQHGHDIVIGADVRLGPGCKVFNGVTLGNKDVALSSAGNQPVVGANVILCTGAKILGAVRIGDHVVIGANSVVVKDCPSNTVFAGVPAVMIKDRR